MRIARTKDSDEEKFFNDYLQAKWNANRALSNLEDQEAKLLNFMELKKRKTLSHTEDGKHYSATFTQRTTTQINEQGLRKALTAKVFDSYTMKKLDRKALEKAMGEGIVDPVIVAKYVEQVPGKKFLTFRTREIDETD